MCTPCRVCSIFILKARVFLNSGSVIVPETTPRLLSINWSGLVAHIAGRYFSGLNLLPTTFDTLPGGIDTFSNEAIILIHPLWDKDSFNYRWEVAAALEDAKSQGFRTTLRSVFHAIRFPYE